MGATTLAGAVVESLKLGEMSPDVQALLLTPTKNKILKRVESQYWDFKEQLDLNQSRDVAKLAKYVLGFHNAQGGALVVGVSKDYAVAGVPRKQVPDRTLARQKVQKYIGPTVPFFTDEIELTPERSLWLVFVPRRQGSPVAVQADSPLGEIRKNEYYVRVDSELKKCVDPIDFERLFSGLSGTHLNAYIYEIDQPYFRLLAPHCEQFVGRNDLLEEVAEALRGRYPMVGLDGVGGVGKSAIAIEVTRRLQRASTYQFVVSLSAKSRVWQGHSATRRAGFAGMTEFLQELARVLQIDVSSDPDTLKRDVISVIAGIEGLLLIDNIEDIEDRQILHFLSREVPDPVKVLVTSRIDRGYGGLFISVPEMDQSEAKDLLLKELEHVHFPYDLNDPKSIDEILTATGRLPLALKWAAGLAAYHGSLTTTSRILRDAGAQKRELLNFCFSTMFDTLSLSARETALLCPFLLGDWNVQCVSLALDRSEDEITQAFEQLKQRGLILAASNSDSTGARVLPLTMDFLAARLHENDAFRLQLKARLDELVGSPELSGFFLNWPEDQRVERFLIKADEAVASGRRDEAMRLVRAAKTWKPSDLRLQFLEGRIDYESGRIQAGLGRMADAMQIEQTGPDAATRYSYLASAMMKYGGQRDENAAVALLERAIEQHVGTGRESIEQYIKLILEHRDYESLRRVLRKVIDTDTALSLLVALDPHLSDPHMIHVICDELLHAANHLKGQRFERERELLSRVRGLAESARLSMNRTSVRPPTP